ncbi:hypothetical protein N7478_011627 [Penicillium angulare]|uniref:uncharacterized protein n=1 Tax=Penicillium angulare TaxID=116970 RepID=UPI002540E7F9|nr:uncharacterized protein N7478_011627 [Penicillium angulare]KAJ5261032.1 hypothetical protein N7478_011627 [Penicillium angulare]
MSNFVHKVKDAISDHDKPVTRSQTSTDPNPNRANPFTSGYGRNQNAPRMSHEEDTDPGFNGPGNTGYGTDPNSKTQTPYGENQRGATRASEASQPSSDIRNSAFSPDDASSRSTSSSDMNAGPHQSKLANKLDPRVDSDNGLQRGNAGNKGMNPSNMPAQQAPSGLQRENAGNKGMNPSNMPAQQAPSGLQRENVGNKGMNPSNMPAQQPGLSQGVDNHSSSEDNFSKSTEEHRHQNQPAQFDYDGNQVPGETHDEDFSTSTEEQKSHKTTSHISPCTSGGMENEQMVDSGPTQPNFGGNSAGGSSSYNQNAGNRIPEGGQDTTMFQKPGTDRTNLPAGQQNAGGDQRVRY